jgi:spore maturation protein CgeB
VKIVIYGLTITSSWGNGHGTTYRSLSKALASMGHRIHFIEKDVEWYRSNRDLPHPAFCSVDLYDSWSDSAASLLKACADADAIIIGSYFPDAIAATRELLDAGFGPLIFYDIDTPITMSQLRACGRTDYLESAMIPHYAAYLSFTGGPVLRELEDHFGSPNAVPFYCSVDPELHRPLPSCKNYLCDLSYLGTYAADRQAKLTRFISGTAALLPESRFLVAGPQYPSEVAWGPNVDRIIHVSPSDHPAFYSSSRFTLNLTRADMVAAGYSPSVRLFEASACGAAILSDGWDGLDEFLTPGEEVLLPHDEYEAASILKYCSEQERTRLGQRARERILSEHTACHRAVQFENVVEQCYAGWTDQRRGSSCSECRHISGDSPLSWVKG